MSSDAAMAYTYPFIETKFSSGEPAGCADKPWRATKPKHKPTQSNLLINAASGDMHPKLEKVGKIGK